MIMMILAMTMMMTTMMTMTTMMAMILKMIVGLPGRQLMHPLIPQQQMTTRQSFTTGEK